MGDPGSGKTRLLAEAVDRFAPDDTARIVGYEPEQSVPLAACAELLQTLSAAPTGRGLRLLFEQGTSALAPMQVFEAAHRALDAFERLLVTVDDLQWVDELSLALCHYLVRARPGRGAAARVDRSSAAIGASRDVGRITGPRASLGPVRESDPRAAVCGGIVSAGEGACARHGRCYRAQRRGAGARVPFLAGGAGAPRRKRRGRCSARDCVARAPMPRPLSDFSPSPLVLYR